MPSFPHIYCISLASELGRRQFMSEQLQALGLSFSLLDAVRYDLSQGFPPQYAQQRRLRHSCVDLRAGQIGCYLSHRLAWQTFLNTSDAHCIVLEDDVQLHADFVATVNTLLREPGDWEFVRFFPFFPRKHLHVKDLGNGHHLVEYLNQPRGTQGYILTRKMAEVLLSHTETMEFPIDDAIDRDWEHRMPLYGVEPAILSHMENFASTLAGGNKLSLSVGQKLLREYHRAGSNLGKQWWILRKRLRHALGNGGRKQAAQPDKR